MNSRNRIKKRGKQKKTQNFRSVSFVVAGIILVGISFGVLNEKEDVQVSDAAPSAEMLALGEQVYTANCAVCHGDQGQGYATEVNAPALNGAEHSWHHPDEQLLDIITNGGIVMPVFGEMLTEQEIVSVINYFQNWWTASQLEMQQGTQKQ